MRRRRQTPTPPPPAPQCPTGPTSPAAGRIRDSIHTASPRNTNPNTRCAVVIHGPLVGMPRPAAAPNASNGVPMPIASRNSAAPPSTGSWLWPMYSTAPASGGATHGPTISADNAPIAATPASEPPRWRSVIAPRRERRAIGSSSSYRPNDDNASATNNAANAAMIHGFWNAGLQVGAEQAGDDAGRGEHQRIGDDVDQRQHQRPRRAQARALAGDQAGQDRDHRQHARRERQQQAGAEEAEQRQPAIGAGKAGGEAAVFR